MSESQNIQQHRLDNGLKVLIKPMRTAPVVSVWVWYQVGSRYERPGITGISHWVEHMLFKGTPDLPKGEIMKSIARAGGTLNGFTSQDNTVYFETVPAEQLDLPLRIESDRMVNSTVDPDEVASERTVIISEREGAENHPFMHLHEAMLGTALQVHPYRWPVLGYRCDLERMTREDLWDYYRAFYGPDNATLVIVGDVEPAAALDQARARFGSIERLNVRHEVRAVEPEQEGERRVEVRRPGNAVYWGACYHMPAYAHEDRVPLMVMDAILSGAKALSVEGGRFGGSARLHAVLVDRKGLAASAGSYARFLRDPSLFHLSMVLRDGVDPAKAEKAMFREIEKLQDKGPGKSELKTALKQVRAQVGYARDGITANAYLIGKLDALGDLTEMDTLAERVAAVTAEDVTRVARQYLSERSRTVGVFIPEGGTVSGAGGAAQAFTGVAFYSASPMGAQASAPAGPVIQRRVLDCGAQVYGVENPESHCVSVGGFLRAGAALDPQGKEGLAVMVARMLDEGTRAKSCHQIAAAADRLGASLEFGADADGTGAGGKCLPADLGRLLALTRECLSEMTCPEDELEKVRQQTLTGMKAQRDSAHYMAMRAAMEALYPPAHPYHREAQGTPESVPAIAREDVLAFAESSYGPQDLTLALVGPLSFARMCDEVEKAFASWRALTQMPTCEVQPVSATAAPGEKIVTMAGKSQCELIVGRIAMPRSHADYHAATVGAMIFGQFGLMGRIGERVRDQLGLAYHASSSVSARRQAGHWTVSAGVNPANVRKALDAIRDETDRFCTEPVTEQELSDAKGKMVGSQVLRMETSDSLCALVRDIAFHELPLDYPARYRDEVRAVTRERVLDVAQRYLRDHEPVIAIAGPELPEA